jgi:hypothetical protein
LPQISARTPSGYLENKNSDNVTKNMESSILIIVDLEYGFQK